MSDHTIYRKHSGTIMPFIMVLLLVTGSCSISPGQGEGQNSPHGLWSVRMADAVMARNENLLQYNGVEKIKWQYDIALLGMAMDKLGHIDKKYSLFMEEFMDYFIQEDGSILKYDLEKYNLDYVNPAKNLITLYKRTGQERYKKALDLIVSQLERQPRTKLGGYWHKQIYPWQMWLDGIYMSAPFMAQYAREFNEPAWFDEAVFQILTIYDRTIDRNSGLLYHAWDESRAEQWSDPSTGRSGQFWGRAMGWYMMALVDVLDYLPEDHPGRKKLLSILQSTSEALVKQRDPDSGLWYQVLDMGGREGNYLEGSASAMYIYTFAKAVRKGYLPKKYLEFARKGFDGLVRDLIRVDEDGLISMTHIVGGCGLGGKPYRDGTYEYYVTEKQVDNDPKGVGPFILAAIELKQ